MNFNKVVFVSGNAVGDVILASPVVKAFSEKFPKSEITMLVRKETAPLVENLQFIHEIVTYEKGDPILPVIRKIWRKDIAICLDFKYRSAVIPFLAAIPIRVGMKHKRKLFLTNYVDRDKAEEEFYEPINFAKIIEKTIDLKLNIDVEKLYISMATDSEKYKVRDLMKPLKKVSSKIVIAPFSSNDAKNWPLERYMLIIEKLNQLGIEIILVGSKADREKGDFSKVRILDLRGQTSLRELSYLLNNVDYFIGSCSGPLHMAAAAEIPIIALYGSTSHYHWAPKAKTNVIVHNIACSPCDRQGYNCAKDYECMNLITVAEVYAAIIEMMEKYPKGDK